MIKAEYKKFVKGCLLQIFNVDFGKKSKISDKLTITSEKDYFYFKRSFPVKSQEIQILFKKC